MSAYLRPRIAQLRALLEELDHQPDLSETLADGAARWLDEHVSRRKPSTAAQYRDATRLLLAALGHARLDAIEPADVRELLATIPEGSRSSVFSAWSACLRWLGMRLGEIVSLRWHEIDLGARIVDLLGRLGASVIAAQPRAGAYVFTPPRKCATPHITGSSVSHACARTLRRYAERTGHSWPRGLCFHSLRHTWASHARAAGVEPEHVRQICGWSTAWMLDRYSHALDEIRACTDRVQARLVEGLQLQLAITTS